MTASLEDVRARLAACGTLAEAIVVGLRLVPPWSVVDVVVQDEFTHDIVMAAGGAPGVGAADGAAGAGPSGPAIVLDCT